MADCKIGYLKTEFSPTRIFLTIELVPMPGLEFDLPLENVASKLDQVANYASSTFGVRTAPVSTNEPGSQGDIGAQTPPAPRGDRKQTAMAKLLKGGSDRAIQVLEGELARAKEDKDPAAIKRAQAQIERAKKIKPKG